MSNFDRISYESGYYFMRDTNNYRVMGTQSGVTSTWLGTLPEGLEEYNDGLTIDYYIPYRSDGEHEVTLNLSSQGAKPVYYNNGRKALTPLTDQALPNTVIRLSYVINDNINNGQGAWLVSGGITVAGVSITTKKDSISSLSFTNGSAPSLETETLTLDHLTSWNPGRMFAVECSNGILNVTSGQLPNLGTPETHSVKVVKTWDAGTMTALQDLGTKTFVTEVTAEG